MNQEGLETFSRLFKEAIEARKAEGMSPHVSGGADDPHRS
jgi:hypothetical protein